VTKNNLESHPRNRHQGFYDFPKLILALPKLKQFVKRNPYGNQTIDFANPEAVKALNQAILKADYQIEWDIPPGFLCPPIPSRADYIHYAYDLLKEIGMDPRGEKIRVLDIGTGANCIYPLIGAKEYSWNFVASDINKTALDNAQKLIETNHLTSKIELRFQPSKTHIFKGIIDPNEPFALSMCNPPFHTSAKQAKLGTLRKWKNLNLKTKALNFGGTNDELWCDGGEVAFIKAMIEESPNYNIKWFTTLVSKEESLKDIYKALEDIKCKKFKTIPMGQGQKKSRIVAWSFLTSS
jgi:23S rRNA (adenine1618-N6)-methyltransferase